MTALRTYWKLLARAPAVLRAIHRSPTLFARLIDQHFAPDAAGAGFAKSLDWLPGVTPLALAVDPAQAAAPALNVLIPVLQLGAMSGGPNTAIQIAARLAADGMPVRFVSTDQPADPDHAALFRHVESLTGIALPRDRVAMVCHADRGVPLVVGPRDVFFATAWWTAQMVKLARPVTGPRRFLYQVAEFEPAFYPAGSEHALALETYGLDMHAIVCESLVGEYLRDARIGRFAEPGFLDRCATFEPAVDRTRFHPAPRPDASGPDRPHRLLFYCRPTKAKRNLSELGLHALGQAARAGVFDGAPWEMLFIGEDLPPVTLAPGLTIRSAPWLDYDGYAALLRGSDLLLSLMLSPHTSYPPLEMAACGGLAVHNTFAVKTADRLRALAAGIVPVEPTVDGIVAGMRDAVARLDQPRDTTVALPASWDVALAPVMPRIRAMVRDCVEGGPD